MTQLTGSRGHHLAQDPFRFQVSIPSSHSRVTTSSGFFTIPVRMPHSGMSYRSLCIILFIPPGATSPSHPEDSRFEPTVSTFAYVPTPPNAPVSARVTAEDTPFPFNAFQGDNPCSFRAVIASAIDKPSDYKSAVKCSFHAANRMNDPSGPSLSPPLAPIVSPASPPPPFSGKS